MRLFSVLAVFLLMTTGSAVRAQQADTPVCLALAFMDGGRSANTSTWLRLQPSRGDSGWAPAEIMAPRTGVSGWQEASWRAPTPDSIHVTWRSPYSSGVFRLQRTSGGFAGVLDSSSHVHVVDSTGAWRPYRQVEDVRASPRSCPRREL
jgi:hypothetical protein